VFATCAFAWCSKPGLSSLESLLRCSKLTFIHMDAQRRDGNDAQRRDGNDAQRRDGCTTQGWMHNAGMAMMHNTGMAMMRLCSLSMKWQLLHSNYDAIDKAQKAKCTQGSWSRGSIRCALIPKFQSTSCSLLRW